MWRGEGSSQKQNEEDMGTKEGKQTPLVLFVVLRAYPQVLIMIITKSVAVAGFVHTKE